MELQLSYIPRRLVRSATCSVSIEHTEQQSNRATEHSAGHVTQRSAVLAAGRDERRRYLTLCLRPYHTNARFFSFAREREPAFDIPAKRRAYLSRKKSHPKPPPVGSHPKSNRQLAKRSSRHSLSQTSLSSPRRFVSRLMQSC